MLALLASCPACFGQLLGTPYRLTVLVSSADGAMRDGDWPKYLEYIEQGLADTAAAQPATTAHSRWNRMFGDNTMALALAQSAFLRRIPPATLTAFQERATNGVDFLRWLLRNEDAMRSFLMTIQPANQASRVLDIWSTLRNCDTNAWDRYWNLGLACALVFDKPMPFNSRISQKGVVNVVERYAFFRNSVAHGRLKTDLPHLSTGELVWVVDAPVPDTDLAWAQEHVHFSRGEWAKAYDLVAYRMDQALNSAQIHPTYTLEEILRVGGVCVERAHFAAMSAKAHGIPAMPLVGEGERGGHAWFAYLASPHVWNMSGGRYGSDLYATGYTCEPQSRQYITEQSLNLLVDTQRNSAQYLLATRLIWLGQLTQARKDAKQAIALFQAAVEASPRHVPAWEALLACLRTAETTKAEWKSVLQTYRGNFKDYPDMAAKVDPLEAEFLLDDASADDILKSLRNETSRLKEKDRVDLVLQTVNRHVTMLQNAGKTNVVLGVYQKALKEFGTELPALHALAGRAFAYAQSVHCEADMLHNIEEACRRQLSDSPQDPFRAKAQAALAEMLAGFYNAAGQHEKGVKYMRMAEKLNK